MSDEQSIIIKRVNKCPHAAHGGAWKIAFADFMTAVTAFFLMLWVLGGTSDEEMKAMAEYFRNPAVIEASPQVLVESKSQGRPTNTIIDAGGFQDMPTGKEGDESGSGKAKEQEEAEMNQLKLMIEQKINADPVLNKLKDQLKLDVTPNGLQIQILDDRKRPMFESGVDIPRDYAARLIREVGEILAQTDRPISIAGHTDASRYASQEYTNWELSADRANAARRLLLRGGVPEKRIAQVVGLADTVPFDKENPYNPRNRRISIIVLSQDAERRLKSLSEAAGVEDLGKELKLPAPQPGHH